MKNYYSCAELAALKLAGYPASERNMRARVVKEGWPAHKRLESGGGMEYQPPKSILAEILKQELMKGAHHETQAKTNTATDTVAGARSPDGIARRDAGQRGQITTAPIYREGGDGQDYATSIRNDGGSTSMDATVISGGIDHSQGRIIGSNTSGKRVHEANTTAIATTKNHLLTRPAKPLTQVQLDVDAATKIISKFVENSRLTVAKTLDLLNHLYADNKLETNLTWAYEHCWDKTRADQKLNLRTYNNWKKSIKKYGTAAPKRVNPDYSIPAWGKVVLQHYRKPQKPTLSQAVAATRQQWDGEYFSDSQARRLLAKIKEFAPEVLYKGRNTGAALKAKMPFIRRATEDLYPNEVWTGDGHGLKAKIAHPDHGRPFTPEITLIVDVYSRKIVGWSVSYSENVIAVSDALRHAISTHGLPLIYYSDNGSGQTARQLDAPIIGMLGNLGIEHITGIPGNPQGRGLIERLWQTLTIPLAKTLLTFRGNGADADTLRLANSAIEKSLRRNQQSALLPSMNDFKTMLEGAINWYNHTHIHSELKTTPAQAFSAKARNDDVVMLDKTQLLHLFRPQEIRTAARGMVSLWNNEYSHPDLMQVDGQKVLVGYDIHDGNFVTVRRMNGDFVCQAEWDAHKRRYVPQSLTNKKRQERHDGKVKRAEQVIIEAEAELNQDGLQRVEMPVLEVPPPLIDGGIYLIADEKEDLATTEEMNLWMFRGGPKPPAVIRQEQKVAREKEAAEKTKADSAKNVENNEEPNKELAAISAN